MFGWIAIWYGESKNLWSNRVLIDFLSQLTDEQRALEVPGTYGSSQAATRHVISSDADYARIIPDAPDVTQIDDDESFELVTSFLLGQIIHHATEHRSQIRTTLSTHGITPPDIDRWAWMRSEEGKALLVDSRAQG